ncbi:MAG: hypothetical protein ACI9TH_000013 [Kiritimatiellia bacterium]
MREMKKQDKSGSILLVALIFMFIGFSAAAVSIRNAVHEGRMVKSQISVERAHYLAEAALELAAAEVATYTGYIPYGEVSRKQRVPIETGNANGTYSYVISKTAFREYQIHSEGHFGGVTRGISIDRVYKPKLPGYSFWADDFNGLYYIPGDVVDGKVYSGTQINIWSSPASTPRGPHFKDEVATGAARFGGLALFAIFDKPSKFNEHKDPLEDINFENEVKGEARHLGLLITGPTEVKFPVNTNLNVDGQEGEIWLKNPRHFGTNTWQAFPLQDLDLIYIEDDLANNLPGTVTIEGGELDGIITIYAEDDVTIKNSITMRNDPRDDDSNAPDFNTPSDDLLGIISKDDIWLDTTWMTSNPDIDLMGAYVAFGTKHGDPSRDKYGNIGVIGHDDTSRGARGVLHVYGSRNMEQGYPYGNFNLRTGNVLSGYKIQSIFDPRFLDNPPPYSPTIGREIKFEGWRYARN